MATLSTHVLDTARGVPAPGLGVIVELHSADGVAWHELGSGTTDADGRVPDLLPEGTQLAPGSYRLHFATGAYHEATGQPVFYPDVAVTFVVAPGSGHHHVPLLLSPFGYSTYRGS